MESMVHDQLSRPFGTRTVLRAGFQPNVETLGYCRTSLRDLSEEGNGCSKGEMRLEGSLVTSAAAKLSGGKNWSFSNGMRVENGREAYLTWQ